MPLGSILSLHLNPYPSEPMDLIISLIQLAVFIVVIAGGWKTFAKAGQPGWAVIIPIYNIYVLTQIAGRPWWWLLLFLVPIVNVVIAIIMSIDVARKFGQSTGFGIGLALLGFIFYPILGFGSATYQGGATAAPEAAEA